MPVLLGTSVIVFVMILATPGDPVQLMLGDQRVSAEQVAALRHDMGLDRPPLERFSVFLARAAHGDFGRSFFHRRPVIDVIAERVPATRESRAQPAYYGPTRDRRNLSSVCQPARDWHSDAAP